MAAASPVIFDDGGSTRIKQVKDDVNMDRLLDALTDQADGSFKDGAGNFRCTMKVRFHDHDGEQHVPLVTVPLAQGDVVTIVSQNQQVARVTFAPVTFVMTIALSSAVGGVVPIVEAKHQGRQRRYIVTNAGAIATVSVNGAQVHPPAGAQPSVYTMILFK